MLLSTTVTGKYSRSLQNKPPEMAAFCACSVDVLKEKTDMNMLLTTEQFSARNVYVHKLTRSTKACYNGIGLEVILSSRKHIPRKPSIKELQVFSDV